MKMYLLALGGILAILLAVKTFVTVDIPKSGNNSTSAFSLEAKTDSQGEVVVAVAPLVIQPDQETKFSVALDTHTIGLDYDLISLSSLSDDRNRRTNAVLWDGGRGGHHLKGTLIFPPVPDDATSITLTILGVSGIDRVFNWR